MDSATSSNPRRSIGEVVVEVGLSILIGVFALVGNVMASLAVVRNPKLRSSTSIFIIALAISDILMALICIPVTIGILVAEDSIDDSSLCYIQGFAVLTLALMSVSTLGLTAVNRFFRVVKPGVYKRFFTKRNSLLLIGTVWLFIVIFYTSLLASAATHVRYEPSYAVCAVAHIPVQTALESFVVIVAFTMIVASYTQVFINIRRHQIAVASSLLGQGAESCLSYEEIKISKLLFVTVLAFSICWIPSLVIITADRMETETTPPRIRTLLCTYLNYISTAVNPIIYGVMNRSFRAEYKRILLCKKTNTVVPYIGSKSARTFRNTARVVMWTNAASPEGETEMEVDDPSAQSKGTLDSGAV